MVGSSPMTASANSEDAVSATPPPQQFKAAPPGVLTREHRAGPRSSHPAGLRPRGNLNRIREASRSPQPVLRCKRRSQLSRDRTPVRPYVLHSRPCRYGGGDMDAIAEGWQGTGAAHPAERSLRHLVISRKVSGGTRSERSTERKMTLASVFGTWRARGLNPLAACRQLLTSPQI